MEERPLDGREKIQYYERTGGSGATDGAVEEPPFMALSIFTPLVEMWGTMKIMPHMFSCIRQHGLLRSSGDVLKYLG